MMMEDKGVYQHIIGGKTYTGRQLIKGMKGLSYGDALEALKLGHKVKRSAWLGYWFYDRPYLVSSKQHEPSGAPGSANISLVSVDSVKMEPMLVAKLENGKYVPAQPYQGDMLADDWMILAE